MGAVGGACLQPEFFQDAWRGGGGVGLGVWSGGAGVGVVGGVFVDDLLHETEEDGDDEGGLESLTEDDEEDGEGEEIHGCARSWLLQGALYLIIFSCPQINQIKSGACPVSCRLIR